MTLPDAPTDLANVESITNKDQIGMVWNEGAANGGTPVIDYRIWYSASSGPYEVLIANVQATEFTANPLTTGVWYSFKVQARNSEGYGDFSNIITVLAAQEPDKPDAPITVWTRDFVTVQWVEPVINGAAILSYNV